MPSDSVEQAHKARGRTVAIVPARGGSKGLPRKNLRLLDGKPLVAHSILAGLGSSHLHETYVSTEDDEIADVARRFGALLIRRPAELAADTAQNDAVMRHAIEHIAAAGGMPATVVLLQPTSPLRGSGQVDACLELYWSSQFASAMSICAVDHHPGKAVVVRDDALEPFTNDRDMEARRQDMLPVYRQNGAIYVVGAEDFLRTGRFYLRPCAGYVMDRSDSVDIDDEFDLTYAVAVLEHRKRLASERS